MSITVELNNVDITDQVAFPSLRVTQMLTSQVDTANFEIDNKDGTRATPEFDDDIEVFDGATKIFGGKVAQVLQKVKSGGGGFVLSVSCVDHTLEFDRQLVARVYENETVEDIIDDIVTSYAPGFTVTNVQSNYLVEKIVFNQVPPSECLKKLATMLRYDWYIDPDKDIHFFPKFTNTAPFGLTDTNGNYIYKSLTRISDGSQLVNRVKVRGGEYDGATYTDTITVSGDDTKSFKLPYRFANLTIELDTGSGFVSQDVGIDFIDDFVTRDVLYNFADANVRFENALSNGDKIRFSGNPKVRVFAVAEDSVSIAAYGRIEKLIRENDIRSNLVARKRALAELLAYNEAIIDAKFKTYEGGLRTGMLINVKSTKRGLDDDLLIKTVVFLPRTPVEFEYQVDCVSTKRYGLIETLQKLLQPEAQDFDEAEVSEDIFSANEVLNILDDTEMIVPVTADEEVEIDENYILDPLGTGVDPIFITAPYTPTSQTDPNRPGRTNISMRTYVS